MNDDEAKSMLEKTFYPNKFIIPYFELGGKGLMYEGCRDQTLQAMIIYGRTTLGFVAETPNQSQKIIKLIRLTENQWNLIPLEIQELHHPTNGRTLLYIKLNDSWSLTPLRLSFLTLIIRLGINYDEKKSLQDSLNEAYYAPVDGANTISLKNTIKILLSHKDLTPLDTYSWKLYKKLYNRDSVIKYCGLLTSHFDEDEKKWINNRVINIQEKLKNEETPNILKVILG